MNETRSMTAAYYERQGAARDVLAVGELPLPEPGPGEVRIRVHASGLNPSDLKARTGFAAPMPFHRIVPHQDGAGVVDAVGAGVPADRVGQRVWIYEAQLGRAGGTAAQFVVVPAANAVPLPDGVPFDVGAALGVPALTAHRCLFADGPLAGRRVLVHGGAGAVGSAAIMLARWAGAWVAATVRNDEQRAVALAAGAHAVLDRAAADLPAAVRAATGGAGVDRIVDVDLKTNLANDLACLAQGGVISAYATGAAADEVAVPLLQAMQHGCVLRFVYVYRMPDDARQAAIAAIGACLAAGAYRPRIGLKLPLARIADAHEALESGKVVGKVLVYDETLPGPPLPVPL